MSILGFKEKVPLNFEKKFLVWWSSLIFVILCPFQRKQLVGIWCDNLNLFFYSALQQGLISSKLCCDGE
jgi:hypothetical protein